MLGDLATSQHSPLTYLLCHVIAMAAKTKATSKGKGAVKAAKTKVVAAAKATSKHKSPPKAKAATCPHTPPTAQKSKPSQQPQSLQSLDLTVDAEDETPPPPKRNREIADCCTGLQRMASGSFYKKQTASEVEEAQDAKNIFDDLDKDNKIEFAKKFKASPKNLGFAKSFNEKRVNTQRVVQTCNEKYRTRNVFRK